MTMAGKVLIIDDTDGSREELSEFLIQRKFQVFTAGSAPSGIAIARKEQPDLILLSLVNSYGAIKGPDICGKLKGDPSTAGIHILVLCLSDLAGQQIVCRQAGADDYMIDSHEDPDIELLAVRCQGLLRRSHGPALKRGCMTLFPETREVKIREKIYSNLTQREFDVHLLLAKRSPRAVSGMAISRMLWGGEPPSRETLKGHRPDLRTVDVHISRIRKKLGIRAWLITKPKAGYQLLDVS